MSQEAEDLEKKVKELEEETKRLEEKFYRSSDAVKIKTILRMQKQTNDFLIWFIKSLQKE